MFVPPKVTSVNTVNVFAVTVPPVKLNPSVNVEGVIPFIDLLFNASTPVRVATVKPLTKILESTIIFAFANRVSVIVVFPFTYKEESNLTFPLTYKESFKEVTLFTAKVESNWTLPKAYTLPLATNESFT